MFRRAFLPSFILALPSLGVLATLFYSGYFAYHDLGIINDFLSFTHWGEPVFWVNDWGKSHLSTHFTPTLLLFVPLFHIFDSPWLLLAINWVFVVAGVAALTAISERFSDAWPVRLRKVGPWLFAAFCLSNLFVKSVTFSGHFEVITFGLACLTLASVTLGKNFLLSLFLMILTAGTRQDAAFFLSFQLLALGLLLRGAARNPSAARQAFMLAALALGICVVSVGFLFPAFGGSSEFHVVRFWGHYGTTWAEVLSNMARSPSRVWHELWSSAMPRISRSVGWIPIINPFSFILNHLPGGLLYVSSAEEKRNLYFYNASFLLPGLLASVPFAGNRLAQLATPLCTIYAGVLIFALGQSLASLGRDAREVIPFSLNAVDKKVIAERSLEVVERECPSAESVAMDFNNIVFSPNHLKKFLTKNYENADAVAWIRGASLENTHASSEAELLNRIGSNTTFRLAQTTSEYVIYVKREKCR